MRYVWFGWLKLLELDALASNAYLRKQTWGLDLAGLNGDLNSLDSAGGIGGLLAVRDANTTTTTGDDKSYVFFYDANGNVREVIDSATNAVAAHYEYDPFGQVVATTGTYAATNTYRFSTKPFDLDTGLGDWGLSWYDARTAATYTDSPAA